MTAETMACSADVASLGEPWRVMTREEYLALDIRGRVAVEMNHDGCGGVAVWMLGSAVPAEGGRPVTLVERLRERWERIDGAPARKIDRILKERREAADRIETLEACLRCDDANVRSAWEREGNWKALAAELLAACETALNDIDHETMPATVKVLMAAVAKAEGRG